MDDMVKNGSVTINNQKMADFFQWAYEKGSEELSRLVREKLLAIKQETKEEEIPKGKPTKEGYVWDDILEPNEKPSQWKLGGDCNKCRKVDYCGTRCRANKLLRAITTPYLYSVYLDEHPEAVAREVAASITPEKILEMAGIDPEEGKLEGDEK